MNTSVRKVGGWYLGAALAAVAVEVGPNILRLAGALVLIGLVPGILLVWAVAGAESSRMETLPRVGMYVVASLGLNAVIGLVLNLASDLTAAHWLIAIGVVSAALGAVTIWRDRSADAAEPTGGLTEAPGATSVLTRPHVAVIAFTVAALAVGVALSVVSARDLNAHAHFAALSLDRRSPSELALGVKNSEGRQATFVVDASGPAGAQSWHITLPAGGTWKADVAGTEANVQATVALASSPGTVIARVGAGGPA